MSGDFCMNKFKRVKPAGADNFINEPLQVSEAVIDEEESDINSGINANEDVKMDINIKTDTDIDTITKTAPGIKKNVLKKYNPRAVKRKVFNVRLNEYYLQAMRQLSNPEEGVSMQKVARELLEKGLDELIKNKS